MQRLPQISWRTLHDTSSSSRLQLYQAIVDDDDRLAVKVFEDRLEEEQGIELQPPGRNLDVDHFVGGAVERRPDVHRAIFNRDFCLVDDHYSMLVRSWPEQVSKGDIPLMNRLV